MRLIKAQRPSARSLYLDLSIDVQNSGGIEWKTADMFLLMFLSKRVVIHKSLKTKLAEGVGFEPTVQTLLSDAAPAEYQLRSMPRTLGSRIAKERRSKSRYFESIRAAGPRRARNRFPPYPAQRRAGARPRLPWPQMNNARSRPPFTCILRSSRKGS